MKFGFVVCALFVIGLVVHSEAAPPNAAGATFMVTGEVVEVKRAAVSAFLRVPPTKRPSDVLSPLVATDAQQLYDAVQRTTKLSSKRLPEVQTRNNQRQFKGGGDTSLEAEPYLDADGHTLHANVVTGVGPKHVAESISAKDGQSTFAGVLDGNSPDTIRLVFIQIRQR